MPSSPSSLQRIFAPSSVAVVGASAEPAKRGHQIVRALQESGFEGSIHPVNPRGGEILGLEVVPSVDVLPEGVDLAVLCTPARAAPDLVRACGSRGIAGAVVLAVGFGESGSEGAALEARLVESAREAGVRLVGPNTSGMLNMHRGVNLVGARGVSAGGLAVLVQSGNMALALMTEVTERSWDGISIYLGVGNEVDLGFAEALDYLEGDDATHAVMGYVEGFRDAGAFLASAARVGRSKPVVLLKSGRTRRGAEAALSHTGAVAGPYRRLQAGMAQAGVVELTRADELLHVAETLGRQPAPAGHAGIAILSDGGGQGTLAVDWLSEAGGRLAVLSDETRAALRALMGPAAAVGNPVDLAGAADAEPEVFGRAMELLVADPAVGTVLLVGLFGGYGIRFAETLLPGEEEAARAMAEAARSAGKGLVVHTMYAAHRSTPLAALGRAGVPVVGSLEVACRCVVELQRRGVWLEGEPWLYAPPAKRDRDRDGCVLTEPQAREALSAAGVSFGPSVVAESADAVVAALDSFDGPVAVKLVSAAITHKSDADGVVLDVASPEDARAAYEKIRDGARRYASAHDVELEEEADGPRVMVVQHHPRPRIELLVGAYRDPDLGPVLSIGSGGLWVEVLDDVAVRVLPVHDVEIDAMLDGLVAARIMAGGRGLAPVDREPVRAVARAVARIMEERPDVMEVEINPLFVYEERVAPVDARMVLREAHP